jgi:lysophospholipase L1-like esterase
VADRKIVAFRTALILTPVVLCLGAMTGVGYLLRIKAISGVHRPPSRQVYHARLGWTGPPGYRNERDFHPQYPFPLSVRINSDGFRDAEWPRPGQRKAGGEWILVLGDSFIFGWASFREDTFTYVAEELAADKGMEATFFNGGMNGYGFHQYHRMLELYADELKPTQVWVMLTPNDVGDSALPYDHRFGQRVYKPFYDESGKLTDSIIRQRASLQYKDSLLGAWPGIYAIDALQYVLEDIRLHKAGLPIRLNSPLPIQHYDDLIHAKATLEKFPAVGRMIRRNIEGMIALAKEKNIRIRFINNASERAFDRYFEGLADYYDPGSPIAPGIWPWLTHINEDHPGYLWALILAAHALGIDNRDGALTRAIAKRLTGSLDFHAQHDAARALSGHGWDIGAGDRLTLKGGATGYLKLFVNRAGRDDVTLSLTTRQVVPHNEIRVSDRYSSCERSSKPPVGERHMEFVCRARLPELPKLGLFRIDAATDVAFAKATIAGTD